MTNQRFILRLALRRALVPSIVVAAVLGVVPTATRANPPAAAPSEAVTGKPLKARLLIPKIDGVDRSPVDADVVIGCEKPFQGAYAERLSAIRLPELEVVRTLDTYGRGASQRSEITCPTASPTADGPVSFLFKNSSCGFCSSIQHASAEEGAGLARPILTIATTTAAPGAAGEREIESSLEVVRLDDHVVEGWTRHRGDLVVLARDVSDYGRSRWSVYRSSTNALARVPEAWTADSVVPRHFLSHDELDVVCFFVSRRGEDRIVEYRFDTGEFHRSEPLADEVGFVMEFRPSEDGQRFLIASPCTLHSYDPATRSIAPFDRELDGSGAFSLDGDSLATARSLGDESLADPDTGIGPDCDWEFVGYRLNHQDLGATELFRRRLAPDSRFFGVQRLVFVAKRDLLFFQGFTHREDQSALYVVDLAE